MDLQDKAMLVAEKAHANQTYDIFPYIYHIRQVSDIARNLECNETIIVSCILHDILEDTGYSYNDIRKFFGEEVAEIVFAVTDEMGRNREERKRLTYPKIKSNWMAIVVKICDRIANVSHSKEYDSSKFKMYQKEHEKFCEELKTENADHNFTCRKAWMMLDKIIA